jgi:L-2-hydroxyglutarate oxidase LhgO
LDVDCIVIGAGVVGLATARALAQRGREVIVLEAESAIGQGVSSRHSEVIHAGIYYPPGSLKAQLCVAGRKLLYAYCEQHAVPHQRIGKLIVAVTDAERSALAKYQERALANGVDDLQPVNATEARAIEPAVHCVAGLWSPSTGIIDTHAYMLALQANIEALGGTVMLRTPVSSGVAGGGTIELHVGGAAPSTVSARLVVNAAGLQAQAVSRSISGLPAASIPPQHLAKGHYFTLSGASPFRHLVYPIAPPGGLGTHVTLNLAGRARFGPDVQWVAETDYGFDETRKGEFVASIRRYYPALDAARLQPDYTGIRPKIVGPDQPDADFCISTTAEHGVYGYAALYGIESPGLTASLALAERVAARLTPHG